MRCSSRSGWLCALALAAPFALAQAPDHEVDPRRPGSAAAEPRAPFLSAEQYGLEQGLSQLSVTALAEDDQGFLWVGTQEGLNRFDGHRFRVFRREGSDGMPGLVSSSVEALAFGAGSRLWIGTNDAGLEVRGLRDGSIVRLGTEAGLSHRTVSQLLLDGEGGAWLGTPVGVDHVDARLQRVVSLGSTGPVAALRQRQGEAPRALGRDCRLWRVGADALQPLPLQLPGGARCVDLRDDGADSWIATAERGVFRVDGHGVVQRHLPAEALRRGAAALTAMLLRADGWLLLGYADGALVQVHADSGAVARRGGIGRRLDSSILLLHEQSPGVLWIGTATAGLFGARTLSAAIRTDIVGARDHAAWPGKSVRSFWRDGSTWLVGTDLGLSMREGDQPWRAVEAIGTTSVRAIAADGGRGWWVGTHRGLWRLQADGSAEQVLGLPDPAVTALLVEGPVLWVATRGGLARLVDGEVQPQPVPAMLDGQFLTSLMRDRDGRLWVGSNERGVFRIDADGALAHLHTRNAGLRHDSVWSLQEHDAAWWIGTFSAGLHRLDRSSGALQVFGEAEGLSNGVVYSILPDADGRLWLSTNDGLNVLDPGSGSVQTLLPADGLRNREFNSGAAFADRDGLLYFGGTEGLDVIEPRHLSAQAAPAVPVPSGLRVLGRRGGGPGTAGRFIDTVYADSVQLDNRDAVLSLELVAIDFAAPSAARLRYRIEGVYADWVQPQGPRTELVLSQLPPGEYNLEMQAAGRDGQFGRTRRLALLMPPPPWRHPLAYAGYVLAALALLAWLLSRLRRRVAAERRQIDVLNRTVAERTAELERANRLLVQSNLQLDLANRTDPLTQLSNRRDLQEWMDGEGQRSVQALAAAAAAGHAPANGPRLFFCMVDLDDFKRVNDSYGHQVGDEVLVDFARRLRGLCRERDIVVRWGGEEFMLLLRDVQVDEVVALVERVRAALEAEPVLLRSGARLSVTCSIGFAPWPLSHQWPTLGDWDQSVALADRALYAAKDAGKNAWIGVVPTAAIDRSSLLMLLGGAAPEDLREGCVEVLHPPHVRPSFLRA